MNEEHYIRIIPRKYMTLFKLEQQALLLDQSEFNLQNLKHEILSKAELKSKKFDDQTMNNLLSSKQITKQDLMRNYNKALKRLNGYAKYQAMWALQQ